jgi:predicted nucleic acid-binding protein
MPAAPLLDTSVLIDVLRGHRPAVAYLREVQAVPFCSELSRIETLRGLRSSERRAAERLLGSLEWAPVDRRVAERAGALGRKWRASHRGIAVTDLAIAATAELLGADLATTNVKHFPMFEGLRPPYAATEG